MFHGLVAEVESWIPGMQPHILPLDLSGAARRRRRRRRQRISVVASTRVAQQSSRQQPDELQRAQVDTASRLP